MTRNNCESVPSILATWCPLHSWPEAVIGGIVPLALAQVNRHEISWA